jgi:hypothetical protein
MMDDCLYVYGGLEMMQGPMADFYRLQLNASPLAWTPLPQPGNPPGPRSRHCLHPYKNSLILYGGVSTSITHNCSTTFQYHLSTLSWRQLAVEGLGPALEGFGSALVRGELWVLCGHDSEMAGYTNAVWRLGLEGGGWQRVAGFEGEGKVAPRYNFGHVFVEKDNCLYGFGGISSRGRLNDLFGYHFEQGYFQIQVENKLAVRSGCTLDHHLGQLFLFGGMHDLTCELD